MVYTLTGAKVRYFRELAGITQSELARHLGYKPQAIWNWEKRTPDRSIPHHLYDPVLTYIRAHYDLATGQQVRANELEQGLEAVTQQPQQAASQVASHAQQPRRRAR
ncbi:MAG TPA: helix-turn-helix transcriptional regulator [Ktedonobacterales bacterium]|jgi:transcriptional regulator with XRE-family HTH domain|nr:helix-turn-helix transcriptional regulator [Ktedonobacterales bacterium]